MLAAGLAAWTAAGYATLERFPPWSSDEAFNLNGAWTSVKTGRIVAGFESDFFLDAVKAPRIGDGGSRPEPFQVRAHPPLRWSARLADHGENATVFSSTKSKWSRWIPGLPSRD